MTRHCLVIQACLDTSIYCVNTSRHYLHMSRYCLDILMIALKMVNSDVNSSLIAGHKISITQEWVICCEVDVCEMGMQIQFLKEIICICILFISTFCLQSYPLNVYCFSYSCPCWYLLKFTIYNYCNIWANQYWSHVPFFMLHSGTGKSHGELEYMYWGMDEKSYQRSPLPVSKNKQAWCQDVFLHRDREYAPAKWVHHGLDTWYPVPLNTILVS